MYIYVHAWNKIRKRDLKFVSKPPGQRSKEHQGSAFGRQRRWWGATDTEQWLRSTLVDDYR